MVSEVSPQLKADLEEDQHHHQSRKRDHLLLSVCRD